MQALRVLGYSQCTVRNSDLYRVPSGLLTDGGWFPVRQRYTPVPRRKLARFLWLSFRRRDNRGGRQRKILIPSVPIDLGPI